MLGELFAEVFIRTPTRAAWRNTTWARALQGLSLAVLGAAVGWGTVLVYPHRFFPDAPVTGLSLLISPLLSAAAMTGYARWRYGETPPRSGLLSFWHAFDFAFGIALTRFLLFQQG